MGEAILVEPPQGFLFHDLGKCTVVLPFGQSTDVSERGGKLGSVSITNVLKLHNAVGIAFLGLDFQGVVRQNAPAIFVEQLLHTTTDISVQLRQV